jgi:hypothetical protein
MANIFFSIDVSPRLPIMTLSHDVLWHQRRTVCAGTQKSLRLAGPMSLDVQMPNHRWLESELLDYLPGGTLLVTGVR